MKDIWSFNVTASTVNSGGRKQTNKYAVAVSMYEVSKW
jgi:hypothetical protein